MVVAQPGGGCVHLHYILRANPPESPFGKGGTRKDAEGLRPSARPDATSVEAGLEPAWKGHIPLSFPRRRESSSGDCRQSALIPHSWGEDKKRRGASPPHCTPSRRIRRGALRCARERCSQPEADCRGNWSETRLRMRGVPRLRNPLESPFAKGGLKRIWGSGGLPRACPSGKRPDTRQSTPPSPVNYALPSHRLRRREERREDFFSPLC